MITEFDKFLIIVGLASTAAFLRYIQRIRPDIESQASIIEWIMIILIPVTAAPTAFKEAEIHPYWNYFVFSLASAIWIGIGVWTGYNSKEGWSLNYKSTFAAICVALVFIGIGLHFLLQAIPFEIYFELNQGK